jgi:hypothetical protein
MRVLDALLRRRHAEQGGVPATKSSDRIQPTPTAGPGQGRQVSDALGSLGAVPRAVDEAAERILKEMECIRGELRVHDEYTRTEVAKELSVQQLIQALSSRLPAIPVGKSADLKEMAQLTENHQKILSILTSDPAESYTYKDIAAIACLTPDGTRGLISQLSRMGYRFRKTRKGKKVCVSLVSSEPSDSSALVTRSSDSSA